MSVEIAKDLKERLAAESLTIGFVGAIASGKSTLSKILSSELNIKRIEENFPENPFLSKFYENHAEYSFRSQTWFLRSTVDQLIVAKRDTLIKSTCLDPANEMNHLFAKTHYNLGWMSLAEFNLYEDLYQTLNEKSGIKKPDLFIWTDAPFEILKKRIIERSRTYELRTLREDHEYLPALRETIKGAVISGYLPNVLYVNTAQSNFSDEVCINGLMEAIKRKT